MKRLGLLAALAVLGLGWAPAARAQLDCQVLTLECKWHWGSYTVLDVDGTEGVLADFPTITPGSSCIEAIDAVLESRFWELATQPVSTAFGVHTLVFASCPPNR
jgi:hypothetical protein